MTEGRADQGAGDSEELEPLVRDAVERAVGPVREIMRLTGGVMNAAFEVRTPERAVVVRVAQRRAPHFDAERHTLDLLAPHDLPTPHVIALEHRPHGSGTQSIIISSKLPGRTAGERDELHDVAGGVIVELGRLLARIHLVTWRDTASPHPGWLAGRLDDIGWMHMGAASAGVDRSAVDRGAEIVRDRPRPSGGAALIHNDFKAGNVLVEDGRVTGIVDFEFTALDDPARDLAFWTFWHGDRAGELIRKGYDTVVAPSEDLDERVLLYRLEIALSYLQWFQTRGVWPGGAALVTRNLVAAASALG